MKRPFRAFATYATNPDGKLVQTVEAFLETLDENPLVREDMRQAIALCVDGSDFRLPKAQAGDEEPIRQLVAEYLSKSDYLIAFVGPASRLHPWIRWEIQWWLTHRDAETLLVALTGGEDVEADPATLFPREIVEAQAHRRIWFDLRGFHRQALRSARSMRPFERELVRMAAYLTHPELSANEFIAHYDVEAARARTRQRLLRAGYSALLSLAVIASVVLLYRAAEYYNQWNAAQLARLSSVADKGDPARITYAAAAFKLAPSPAHFETLSDALQGWLPHAARMDPATRRPVGAVAYLARKRIVVGGGYDGVLHFHDLNTAKLLHTSHVEPRIDSIVVDQAESVLLAGTRKGLFLLDISQLPEVQPSLIAKAFTDEAFYAATAAPNGDFVAGSLSGHLVIMPAKADKRRAWTPRREVRMRDRIGATLGISGVGYAARGEILLVAALNGDFRGYKSGNFEQPLWSRKHSTSIRGLATSIHGSAALIDRNGDVLLIDPTTGATQRQAPRQVQPTQLAKSPGGDVLLDPHQRQARTAVTFSPDGRMVAVGSFDGTVELLDAQTLNLIGRVRKADFARQAAFTPDGEFLIVSGDDGTVDVYRTDSDLEKLRLSGVKLFDVAPRTGWMAVLDRQEQLWLIPAGGNKAEPVALRADASPQAEVKDIRVSGSETNVVGAQSSSVLIRNWRVNARGDSIEAFEARPPGPFEHAGQRCYRSFDRGAKPRPYYRQ